MDFSEILKTAKGLSDDSRYVEPGFVFFCKGNHFKKEYYNQAVKKGAIAYVSEEDFGDEIPKFLVPNIREAMADICKDYYSNPSQKLRLIGITGTKGKSTILYYLKSIMEHSELCGRGKFGFVSTIENYDGKDLAEAHLTTPEPVELNRLLSSMVSNGITFAGMEVSSQGLKYERVKGLSYEISCFTNFSKDHISKLEHESLEDYFESKLKLIPLSKSFILNLDDEKAPLVLKRCKELGVECIGISTLGKSVSDMQCFNAFDIRKENGKTVFDSDFGTLTLSMPGLFNVYNALFAAVFARKLGAKDEEIREGLLVAKASGRMEITENKERNVIGIVDFAHNKLSFEKIMESARAEYPGYTLEAVFGCPGGKSPERRSDLPEMAAKYCDYSYITEDDPYTENALDICNAVYENLLSFGGKGEIILDREKAISKAISKAKNKTVILFLAKGSDTYMHRASFDPYKGDSVLVRELLNT